MYIPLRIHVWFIYLHLVDFFFGGGVMSPWGGNSQVQDEEAPEEEDSVQLTPEEDGEKAMVLWQLIILLFNSAPNTLWKGV